MRENMMDLNLLVDSQGVILTRAIDINNDGQIIAIIIATLLIGRSNDAVEAWRLKDLLMAELIFHPKV